jgi:hypothetical protein
MGKLLLTSGDDDNLGCVARPGVTRQERVRGAPAYAMVGVEHDLDQGECA